MSSKVKTIKIIVEETKDGFSAYADNVEGIYAGGDTLNEVKSNILNAIKLLKENNTENNIPEILKGEYQIVHL